MTRFDLRQLTRSPLVQFPDWPLACRRLGKSQLEPIPGLGDGTAIDCAVTASPAPILQARLDFSPITPRSKIHLQVESWLPISARMDPRFPAVDVCLSRNNCRYARHLEDVELGRRASLVTEGGLRIQLVAMTYTGPLVLYW